MRAVAFTMLARGSGPEQRTRLALPWRQISCEYSGVGRPQGCMPGCGGLWESRGCLLQSCPCYWHLRQPKEESLLRALVVNLGAGGHVRWICLPRWVCSCAQKSTPAPSSLVWDSPVVLMASLALVFHWLGEPGDFSSASNFPALKWRDLENS